jgi:hypothetical protein
MISESRQSFKGWSIETELVSAEDSMVVMKSTIRDAMARLQLPDTLKKTVALGRLTRPLR